jgi:hypothetical protein
MHDMINLTYLYAAGIEPRRELWPRRRRRGRRPTRAALGWLLLATGKMLERAGTRLSGAYPTLAPVGPR